MSLKAIQLNRAKIAEALGSFHPEARVFGPEKKSADLHIYTIRIPKEEEAKLNVYYLKDGGTTLSATSGKNAPLSLRVAEHVKDVCEVKDVSSKPLYVKKMTDDEYGILCEFLKESGAKFEDGKNLSHGKQFKVSEPYGGHLLFNRYTTGSFQVQGNNAILKSWVIDGLSNLLPYKDVIDMQLESLDVEITTDQAISGLKQALPTAYDFLGDTLVAIISPSIALSTVNIELSDYSAFVFPALRGLEGYIKKLFKEKGITVTSDGFGAYIQVLASGVAEMNSNTKTIISSPKLIRAIEDSYNYFRINRHGLFHVDGMIDPTRVIETKKESEEILKDVFDKIEQTFVSYKS